MSNHNKENDKNFMLKISTFIVDKRNLFYLLFTLMIIFSAISTGWVEVEDDLAAYLPADSETNLGLNIMEDQFITFGTAKIMISNISYKQAEILKSEIENVDGVTSITFDETSEHFSNASALFDITFDWDENDEACLESLDNVKELLGDYDIYVSTLMGNDLQATIDKEIRVIMVIVAVIVVSIILLTSETFAEVPVLLLTFVAAAIINMGTNFLLGKISFVSNSVTIVLQLALSIDYAIILCHRFKEERQTMDARSATILALSKAIPEITSSSMTTIGGLMAMTFMQFKIGMDLGICLIKAILISLLAVFVLMPGLLMLFSDWIDKTKHKSYVPKIPFVGKFAYKTRKIIPPIFAVLIVIAFILSSNCHYVYGYSSLTTPKLNENQIAQQMIEDNFDTPNLIAVIVPAGDYKAEAALMEELSKYDEVNSCMGLSNIEAMDGYMLTDGLTPRQFSELTDIDYEKVQLLYAAYAVDDENYAKAINGLSNYKIPLIDLFIFLYDGTQDGYLTLDDEFQETLDDAYKQMYDAKLQLQGNKYSRLLVSMNLPEDGDETYAFLEEIHKVAAKYYPEDVYLAGESTSYYDLGKTFDRDNKVVNVLSILIVMVVLLFTFKSVGMPILLILVIQGCIWVSFSIPTLQLSPVFFMSYLIVSSIQMGANIDYAIVISSRYMELRETMNRRESIIETMNLAFPTIITSGLILAIAGFLVGNMTSEPTVTGIGQSLGRGTLISLVFVMFVLPQLLILGDNIIHKSSFSIKLSIASQRLTGIVRLDGMVRGEINGKINGIVHGTVRGDVNVNVLAGSASAQEINNDSENFKLESSEYIKQLEDKNE